MQAAPVITKIEIMVGGSRKSWCAPQLRVESIAAITRGGLESTVDTGCGPDGGGCIP